MAHSPDGLLVAGRQPGPSAAGADQGRGPRAVVAVVVLTPAGSWGVMACQAALVAVVAAVARLPARLVARRMAVEMPFVVFALLLPFVAAGPTTQPSGR